MYVARELINWGQGVEPGGPGHVRSKGAYKLGTGGGARGPRSCT